MYYVVSVGSCSDWWVVVIDAFVEVVLVDCEVFAVVDVVVVIMFGGGCDGGSSIVSV